jgi:hypothetical protein
MKVASFLLVAFAACTRANDINLDDPEAAIAILQGLWDQTDADEDGALSLSEFNDAANKVHASTQARAHRCAAWRSRLTAGTRSSCILMLRNNHTHRPSDARASLPTPTPIPVHSSASRQRSSHRTTRALRSSSNR